MTDVMEEQAAPTAEQASIPGILAVEVPPSRAGKAKVAKLDGLKDAANSLRTLIPGQWAVIMEGRSQIQDFPKPIKNGEGPFAPTDEHPGTFEAKAIPQPETVPGERHLKLYARYVPPAAGKADNGGQPVPEQAPAPAGTADPGAW